MIFVRTLGCLLRVRGKVLFLGSAVLIKVLQVSVYQPIVAFFSLRLVGMNYAELAFDFSTAFGSLFNCFTNSNAKGSGNISSTAALIAS